MPHKSGRKEYTRGEKRVIAREKPVPRGSAVGRAGGYAAPVDTAGMDPEMKRTLRIGAKKRGK